MASIADDDYEVIINLGLADGKYALADEAASVTNLGMAYCHIPVMFDNPQIAELKVFIETMDQYAGKKTLVHCAANYRASVFTSLYLLAAAKMDEDEMHTLIEGIWQPDGIWEQFIEEGVGYIKQKVKK